MMLATIESEPFVQPSILQRIGVGDQTAVSDCLRQYGALVWSLARRMSPTVADAEDAVQEIFIELWQKAKLYNPEIAGEATFITLIARRRLIDRHRRYVPLKNLTDRDEIPTMEDDEGPSQRLEIDDEAAKALRCLERLPEESRRVLELNIQHGLPQSQVAEQLRMPLGTVKSLARRALIRVRDCMQLRASMMATKGNA